MDACYARRMNPSSTPTRATCSCWTGRSTLQAEMLSMISGMEECERVRYVLHGLWREHGHDLLQSQIAAQDAVKMNLYTDCCSLSEHVGQPGLHSVQDKRLAINLSATRQLVWRQPGELLGDPLLTNHIPPDRTTSLVWTSTDRVPADCLIKAMKPATLLEVMKGHCNDLTPKNRHRQRPV